MPSISFITACDPARSQHLGDTAASVHAAVSYLSSRGVDADWIVVIDGPGQLPKFRTGEYTTLTRLPSASGVAAARNTGLVSSRAAWVCALDADDLVNGAGVAELLDRYGSRVRSGMTLPGLSAPVDMASSKDSDPPGWILADHTWVDRAGPRSALSRAVRLEAGQLADAWPRTLPVHAGNLLVDRDVAISAGGWPGLPAEEDTGLALHVSELRPGVCDPVPVFKRRTWDGQLSATEGYEQVAHGSRWALAATVNGRRSWAWPDRASVSAPH